MLFGKKRDELFSPDSGTCANTCELEALCPCSSTSAPTVCFPELSSDQIPAAGPCKVLLFKAMTEHQKYVPLQHRERDVDRVMQQQKHAIVLMDTRLLISEKQRIRDGTSDRRTRGRERRKGKSNMLVSVVLELQ